MNRGSILKKLSVYLLASMISSAFALAQDHRALIHFDKPYYVTGELIQYKLYLPVGISSGQPVFKVALFNDSGDIVDQSFLQKTEQPFLSGHYKIPFETSPGVYQMMVSSLDENSNQQIEIARFSLPIYSDSYLPQEGNDDKVQNGNQHVSPSQELTISINLKNQKIKPRDGVGLSVVVHDLLGNPVKSNLSISITDIGIIGSNESHPFNSIYRSSNPVEVADLSEYIPFDGQLQNSQEGVMLTFFMPVSNKIYYTTSGTNGNFQLLIPRFYGDQTLQYIGQFSENIPVMKKEANSFTSPTGNLVYTPSITGYLEESKKRKQIYRLYSRVESNYSFVTPETNSIYQPDRAFQASNYPFEDIPTFCREISTPLKYIKDQDGNFNFKMFNPESRNFYYGNPLFIVDGQMTKDVAYLSTLDFTEIDRLNLYYSNAGLSDNFGFAGFSGVVMVYSRQGDFKIPESSSIQKFDISGLQPLISGTEDPDQYSSGEPIFKPQLLWNSSLETSTTGQLEITYQQSDDISKFQIEIVAQSDDGRIGHERIIYQVD